MQLSADVYSAAAASVLAFICWWLFSKKPRLDHDSLLPGAGLCLDIKRKKTNMWSDVIPLCMVPLLMIVIAGLQAGELDGATSHKVSSSNGGFSAAATPGLASFAERSLLSVRKILADAAGMRQSKASETVGDSGSSVTRCDSCHGSWEGGFSVNMGGVPASGAPGDEPNSSLTDIFVGEKNTSLIPVFGQPSGESNTSFSEQVSAVGKDQFFFQPDREENDPASHMTMDLVRVGEEWNIIDGVVHFKSAYYGTIMMGNPPKPFTVVFDTGSGHLILPSMYCHTETCKAHRRYKRSGSDTAVDIDGNGGAITPGRPRDQVTINFGTGDVTGVFVEDDLCFGEPAADTGVPESNLPAIENQKNCVRMRFIAATDMSEDPFKDFLFDGVLGLGLNALSQTPEFNFLDVVSGLAQTRGSANHKAFGIFLATHNQETSQITMGGWAEHHMHDEVHWSSVFEPEHGHWLLEIKSLRVNGEAIPYCEEGCKAVVDSGTSLLSVPTPFFPEIYGLLKHPASLEGDCVTQSPQLEVELEGFTLVLDGGDFARLDEHPPSTKTSWGKKATLSEDKTRSDMTCKPMLMVMDLPEPIGPKLFILGEPALKKYYTVYDAEKQRIGFSRARHSLEAPAAEDDESWWVEAEEEFAEEEAKEAEKARLDASIEQAEEESAEKEKDDEEEAKGDYETMVGDSMDQMQSEQDETQLPTDDEHQHLDSDDNDLDASTEWDREMLKIDMENEESAEKEKDDEDEAKEDYETMVGDSMDQMQSEQDETELPKDDEHQHLDSDDIDLDASAEWDREMLKIDMESEEWDPSRGDTQEDEGQDEERYDGEDEEAVHDDELGLDMTPEDSIGSSEEQIETEPVDTQGPEREGTQSVEVGHHDGNDVESGSEMDILAREVPRTEVEAEQEWKTKGLADYEDHDRESQHEEGDMTQMGHQRESYEQGRSFPELSEETTVDCGGHRAATCADCPWDMGAAWCNGNCIWANGACIQAAANLEASPHEEMQARSEGTPAWKKANRFPFKPTLQQQLADLVPRTLEDQEAAWRRRVLELTSGLPQEQPSDLQQQVSELLGLGKASALQRQMADLVGLPIS